MANQEHLELLKQGVAQWNEWREQHPEIRPDLSEAHLRIADLGNANLDGAYLRGANLHRANLHGASLIGADLRQALQPHFCEVTFA